MRRRAWFVPIVLAAAVSLAGAALAEPTDPIRTPSTVTGSLVAHVKPGSVVNVRARPFGRVLAEVSSRTEFGSSTALSVARTLRGRWLAVRTPLLPNGSVGWVDARAGGLRFAHSSVELEVDLSRRELRVLVGGRVTQAWPVAVGRPGSETPTGHFAVTDKLPGSRYSPDYGCCILALSGHQTHLPPGWSGGSRLAIHGTPNPADIGRAVSAGCLHASSHALLYLMRRVPLGASVLIHA